MRTKLASIDSLRQVFRIFSAYWRKIALITLISISLSATCQIPNPEHVTSISNGAFGPSPILQGVKQVVVSNGYAYAMSYYTNSIEIIYISNPSLPTVVSRISRDSLDFLVALPKAMQIVEQYLYVLSIGDKALEIIDIADPTHPKHIGNIVHGDGGANFSRPKDLAVRNGFAYALVDDGIEIIDVSNPHNPIHSGFMDLNLSFWGLIRISGNYLYVHTGSFMGIFDISTPSTPVTESYFQLVPNSEPKAFYVEGNYAYHAWGGVNTDGFEIIDVSNPTSPTRTAQLLAGQGGAVLQEPSALFTKEGFAYIVSAESNILEIINVQDPQHPGKVGALTQLGSPESITMASNLAFIGGNQSLNIVDVSSASNPILIKSINNSLGGSKLKFVVDISVNDDRAYILCESNLEVLDVSNPRDIKRTGRLDYSTPQFSPSTSKIFARSEQVFVLDNAGLSIYDKNLNLIGQTFGKVKSVENFFKPFLYVRGRYVFWMNHYGSLIEVTDVSNPAQPVQVAEIDLQFNHQRDIGILGNYIYAAGDGILKVIDIRNPQIISSNILSNAEIDPRTKYHITTGNNRVFLFIDNVFTENALTILDVSEPVNPKVVNNSALTISNGSMILYHEEYLYLLNPSAKTFDVIDFSNPAQPKTIASLKNGIDDIVINYPNTFTIAGSNAYIGNLFGLEIINLNIPLVTGLDTQNSPDKNITIYPNPATTEISIAIDNLVEDSLIIVDLFDTYGRHIERIKTKGEKFVNVDISKLNEGVHILSVVNGSNRSYSKFLK